MIFKFKRYKVWHKKKAYYIFIPEGINDNLWMNTFNDDWWGGPFLTGSVKAIRILTACFALLGFNPYAVIYLPIRNHRIPGAYAGNPENGNYDVLFRTNRVHMKDKDWKGIRAKLKKCKWTRYKFHFKEERVKAYFKKDIEFLENVRVEKILHSAGSDMWLSCGTVFCSFPRSIYRCCAVETWEYIKAGLSDGSIGGYYEEKYDRWTANLIGSVAGWVPFWRKKLSYEKPGICLNLEIYDLHIVNRRLKKKDYLMKIDRKALNPRDSPWVNMFKIKINL